MLYAISQTNLRSVQRPNSHGFSKCSFNQVKLVKSRCLKGFQVFASADASTSGASPSLTSPTRGILRNSPNRNASDATPCTTQQRSPLSPSRSVRFALPDAVEVDQEEDSLDQ